MVRVFALDSLVNLERGKAGGRVVEGVQVSEDELEGGPLPGWHTTDLLKTAIASENLLDIYSIEVSTNVEMNFVVVLCSH